jgi:hypothetical protein
MRGLTPETLMYLAKFFHRPPGDEDRELLFIPDGGPMIIGIYMHNSSGSQRDDFLREEFADFGTAVAALRRHAANLIAAGYVETTHTRYTLRNLLPDPQPKLAWQRDLDELMLAAFSDPREEQARRLAELKETEAARQPLYLWLAAHQSLVAGEDPERTIQLAEVARDTLAQRKAGKTPHYAWSMIESELEARIFEVQSYSHLRANNPAAALEAIERAYKVAASQDRGVLRATILCDHFPDRQTEAFDAAIKYGQFGGYEAIMALPACAAYVESRKRKPKSDKGWRWKAKKPADKAALLQAEAQLGAELPRDYRGFLGTFGPTALSIQLPEHSSEFGFYQPAELATQRSNLFNFITRTEKDPEKAIAYFRETYGVSLRDLVPVAEPAQESRCLVIHLEKGNRYGWCFHWDHDDSWELEHAAPSFDAALKALTDGIVRRDTAMLNCLGIHLD